MRRREARGGFPEGEAGSDAGARCARRRRTRPHSTGREASTAGMLTLAPARAATRPTSPPGPTPLRSHSAAQHALPHVPARVDRGGGGGRGSGEAVVGPQVRPRPSGPPSALRSALYAPCHCLLDCARRQRVLGRLPQGALLRSQASSSQCSAQACRVSFELRLFRSEDFWRSTHAGKFAVCARALSAVRHRLVPPRLHRVPSYTPQPTHASLHE